MFKGLTSAEAEASRAKYGSNAIPESEPSTFWEEFKKTFGDPMIRILLVIAALMIVMYFFGLSEIYEPIGTIMAVLIVACVSAKTGVASDVKYRELKERSRHEVCRALRNGAAELVNFDDVVVGDVILLGAGDKIPADGVLVSGEIRVNNSSLNGEVEECPKRASETAEFPADITGDTLVDAHTLFRGSVVFGGDGLMEVRKVGLDTMMGRMAQEMSEGEPDSPLKVKLSKLASQISVFGYVGASLITLLYIALFMMKAGGPAEWWALGFRSVLSDAVRALSLGIVIVVCAVPEGLPLMISLVLMQNTGKMLERNVLVRTAVGIETAGSLNILFSDKTGTITKGVLEVTDFFTADTRPMTRDEIAAHPELERLITMSVCRNTQAVFDSAGKVIGGNITDKALMEFFGGECAASSAADAPGDRHQVFSSANKFSQVFIASEGRTYYKGAPEKLLARAVKYADADGVLHDIDIDVINRKMDELSARAMRVIALGYSDGEMTEDAVNDGLVLIGLLSIRDDVRPEARDAIREVLDAGIQVVMITGDRLETAAAIGRDAELLTGDDVVLTSAKMAEMSDEELKALLPRIRVIARALPTDKSRMVRLCQEMNLVVGMTGDGVNDSPSLKRADVGFAMGSGTEAAKEASEIIIVDDNFKSIKDAIWFGRTIYHNILKFCRFQLVINVAAVAVSAIAPFLGVEEPLKVTHLLFVNLVMDSLGALMFGSEPALERYMRERPRRRDESLISADMARQILIGGAWITAVSFLFLKHPFFIDIFDSEAQHLTCYFVLFILFALFNGFNVRDDGFALFGGLGENRSFLKVFISIALIQALIVNAALIPGLGVVGSMFSCVPFGLAGWLAALCLAVTIIPVDMIRKALRPRRR